MNIPLTLTYLRPGEAWTLDGDTLDGLTWLADTTPPTAAEVEAAAPQAEAAAAAAEEARQSGLRKIAQASGLTADELHALGL